MLKSALWPVLLLGCGDARTVAPASGGFAGQPAGTANGDALPLPTGDAGMSSDSLGGNSGSNQSTSGARMGGAPPSDGGVAMGGTWTVGSSSFASCALSFPYQDEAARGTWLGGDSAYSLLLNPTTALWSFQDTFVGKHGQTARAGSAMIANSFALVSCRGAERKIEYFWGTDADGNSPHAIFSDGTANQRFWPQQPFTYQGSLFAAMTRVRDGADEIGTTLARVDNPLDPPSKWQARYFELAKLPGLGKGTLIDGDYAYLFGNAGQALVTRLRLDKLIAPNAVPSEILEYLASDGQWQPGLDTSKAQKLGFSANVGTSFRYLSDSKQWLVLFTNTAGWPAPNISVSTAPSLTGPWSEPIDVYRVPEMTPDSPEYDKDTVCYAAIEHPESNSAPESDLLFSYTCNSLVFEKQLANMGIYLPKVVRIKNPVLP